MSCADEIYALQRFVYGVPYRAEIIQICSNQTNDENKLPRNVIFIMFYKIDLKDLDRFERFLAKGDYFCNSLTKYSCISTAKYELFHRKRIIFSLFFLILHAIRTNYSLQV